MITQHIEATNTAVLRRIATHLRAIQDVDSTQGKTQENSEAKSSSEGDETGKNETAVRVGVETTTSPGESRKEAEAEAESRKEAEAGGGGGGGAGHDHGPPSTNTKNANIANGSNDAPDTLTAASTPAVVSKSTATQSEREQLRGLQSSNTLTPY